LIRLGYNFVLIDVIDNFKTLPFIIDSYN